MGGVFFRGRKNARGGSKGYGRGCSNPKFNGQRLRAAAERRMSPCVSETHRQPDSCSEPLLNPSVGDRSHSVNNLTPFLRLLLFHPPHLHLHLTIPTNLTLSRRTYCTAPSLLYYCFWARVTLKTKPELNTISTAIHLCLFVFCARTDLSTERQQRDPFCNTHLHAASVHA